MYLYSDRILIPILAFSLGPLLGILTTALTNYYLGILGGIVGFTAIIAQPLLSDICLKNTATALQLGEVILAEGKVKYYNRTGIISGKLFLCSDKILFLVENKVDVVIPLKSVEYVEMKSQSENHLADTKELGVILEKNYPNLYQLVTMVNSLADNSSGLIKLKVKDRVFSNCFSFEVSTPKLWLSKIKELKKNRKGEVCSKC